MIPEDPAAWEWMLKGRYLGFTLTFTHKITPEELLRRYGIDPAPARHLPFRDINTELQPGQDDAILRVGMLHDWAFGMEILGVRGKRTDTLAEISRGTQTISVHVGVGAMNLATTWVDGQPRERFEAGDAFTLRAAGAHPFWDATERHRNASPSVSGDLALLQAAEEIIGDHLTSQIDDGPLLSIVLPQVLPRPSPIPQLPRVNPK